MAFTNQPAYHWRELPQVSFWSRQKFCRDKHVFCRDKTRLFCLDKSMLSATKPLSRQKCLSNTCVCVCVCVSRQVLSRQAYFSREKTCLLSRQTRFCRCKTFVATEMILVAAPTNETCQQRSSSDTSILCLPSVRRHSLGQRSFSYAAPSVWNSLPCKVRSSNTPTAFKSPLKSHLFKLSY